jgi:hypothetical protein
MGFNNRTADRKSNPHAVVLCCVERFKEPVDSIGSVTDSGVLHGQLNVLATAAISFAAPNRPSERPLEGAIA